ncbi:translesion DNA synthesis-associated protein ImuA [Castellaniella sp. GW247-6E4]|uniref:translesion DNA synthesis-associated protein ImuA n=1 Tax=Castellaniella sp. GW247-6E4 TaxID=3140380 RepID=UPI003314BC81
MAAPPASTVLQHPERIHPALWRASQLAPARRAVVSTGHEALDRELPGGGWPLGTLIELLSERPGIGELLLLRPALAALDPRRLILLIDPPHPPSMQCWANWGLQPRRLAWLRAGTAPERLWAAEQAVRHDVCAALLCWVGPASGQALLRLQRLARSGHSLLILLRPRSAARQASPAALRLSLEPSPQGLSLGILKRRGPALPEAIVIHLYSDALDLPAPAPARAWRPARAGRPLAALYAASGHS